MDRFNELNVSGRSPDPGSLEINMSRQLSVAIAAIDRFSVTSSALRMHLRTQKPPLGPLVCVRLD